MSVWMIKIESLTPGSAGMAAPYHKHPQIFYLNHVIGKDLDDVKKIGKAEILELLGIELGPVRLKCALLGLKVLKAGAYGLGESSDEWVDDSDGING